MFALIVLVRVIVSLGFAAQPEPPVVRTLDHFKALIKAEPSLSGRVRHFEALKRELKAQVDLAERSGTESNRSARFTLYGLDLYLDQIATAKLDKVECRRMGDRIRFLALPPSSSLESLPGEAAEAIKILDLLCR